MASALAIPSRFCTFTAPTAIAPPTPVAEPAPTPAPTPASAVWLFVVPRARVSATVRLAAVIVVVASPSRVLIASAPPPAREPAPLPPLRATATAADLAEIEALRFAALALLAVTVRAAALEPAAMFWKLEAVLLLSVLRARETPMATAPATPPPKLAPTATAAPQEVVSAEVVSLLLILRSPLSMLIVLPLVAPRKAWITTRERLVASEPAPTREALTPPETERSAAKLST